MTNDTNAAIPIEPQSPPAGATSASDAPTPVETVPVAVDGGKATQEGRGDGGRFGAGNSLGRGRVDARQASHWRCLLATSLTDADVTAAVGVLRDVMTNERPRGEDLARVTAAGKLLDFAMGR